MRLGLGCSSAAGVWTVSAGSRQSARSRGHCTPTRRPDPVGRRRGARGEAAPLGSAHEARPPRQRRVHRRGDRTGAPRGRRHGVVVALSGAPGSLALAALLAAVPVGPLVGCFMWLDRYEPEPRRLLVAGLLWGAFAATGAALVFQGIGGLAGGCDRARALASWRRSPRRSPRGLPACCSCGGAGTSSTACSTASSTPAWSASGSPSPRTSSTSQRPTTAPTALGPGGTTALTGTFIVRCLVSPFAHPFFTAFIGIGVGIAIASRRTLRCESSRRWSA